jgi:hypothetical protein
MTDPRSSRGQDIVERLQAVSSTEISTIYELTREAAAEIERLRAVLQEMPICGTTTHHPPR